MSSYSHFFHEYLERKSKKGMRWEETNEGVAVQATPGCCRQCFSAGDLQPAAAGRISGNSLPRWDFYMVKQRGRATKMKGVRGRQRWKCMSLSFFSPQIPFIFPPPPSPRSHGHKAWTHETLSKDFVIPDDPTVGSHWFQGASFWNVMDIPSKFHDDRR